VVADAGYGVSAGFRRGLSARGLVWAVGVPRVQNVYAAGVELLWPRAATGRPRKRPVPSEEPVAAEAMLGGAAWRRVSWRRGTKGPLAAEFAALRVRPAEGEQLRSGRHPPGAEVWLVGERRATGERKYHLANLPADASLEELAATIKARPRPAAAGRPCGDGSGAARSTGARAGAPAAQGGWTAAPSRGLGHFEGRSWTGLHRHALMAMLAFCFLQHLRLKERGKKRGRPPGATTAAEPARRPPSAARAVPRRPRPVPVLPDRPRTGATVRSAKVALAV
jgi:SRSO17 transposase